MQPDIKNDMLYLLRILESIEKIKIYAHDFSTSEELFFANEQKEYNACLAMLANIGEQISLISIELKQKHNSIEWQKIKLFRNKIVHNYVSVDVAIVFDIIKNKLDVLKKEINTILQKELKQGTFSLNELDVAITSIYLKHVKFDDFYKS